MAQVIVNDTSLTAIANAIRAKNGSNTTYTPSQMATAIGNISGGGGIQHPSGTIDIIWLSYFFQNLTDEKYRMIWLPLFKNNKITFGVNDNNIAGASNYGVKDLTGLFRNIDISNLTLEELNYIPDIYIQDNVDYIQASNFLTVSGPSLGSALLNSVEGQTFLLKKIKKPANFTKTTTYLRTNNLKSNLGIDKGITIPREWGLSNSPINIETWSSYINNNLFNIFNGAQKMLTIFPEVLEKFWTNNYAPINFNNCFWLDKIENLRMVPTTSTSNLYGSFLGGNCNLRKIKFKNDGSTTTSLKNQTITIPMATGFVLNANSNEDTHKSESERLAYYSNPVMLGSNTAQKIRGEHYNDVIVGPSSYNNQKNNEFATAIFKDYSLYNHDSAVETINSLPDCVYKEDNTMTLHFYAPSAGSATDGGAISDLTAAEIAVATDKGWTVTFGSQ